MRRKKHIFNALFTVLAAFLISFHAIGNTYEFEIDLSEPANLSNEGFSISYNEGLATAFSISGASVTTITQQFSWTHSGCGLSMPNSRSFPVWKMEGVFNGITGYEDGSTWIDITVTGDAELKAIELTGTGVSSGGNVCTAGFSTTTDGTGYEDGYLAGFYSGACTGHSISAPSGKEIKSIRLVSSNNFAGIQYNGASGGVTMKDLKVRISYVTTGIENTIPNSLKLNISSQGIKSSTPCRIRIYTPSGILIKEEDRTEYSSTADLPTGAYLVYGETPDGQKRVIRFIK
ncbi:MAG: hypothetical protein LUG18_15850 [Candidatus Azobacteroides sp.]|nr:hypothetical protein [Candidatus Azobacteroides sp.]